MEGQGQKTRSRFEEGVSSSLLGAGLLKPPNPNPPPKLNKNRVLVSPGKSMVEWMRLQSINTHPVPKPRKIGVDELAAHNTLGDLWIGINEHVFDVSKYIEYHPGGVEELMKGAGQDGTALFNQAHRWVNYESILKTTFVGRLVSESTLQTMKGKEVVVVPTTRFSEDEESLFLEIDSHLDAESVRRESWTVGLLNRERLLLRVMVKPPKVWISHIKLLQSLTEDHIGINYKSDFKRMVLTFKKPQALEQWQRLGSPLAENNQLLDSRSVIPDLFCDSKITRRKELTHNTYLFSVRVPPSAFIGVPVGCHVQLRLNKRITRPYTPVTQFLTPDGNRNDLDHQLDFIIKTYPDGLFTSTLKKLTESGQEIDIQVGCPGGSFDPVFLHGVDTLCILAAGSGITPFVRIIEYLHQRRSSLPIPNVVLMFFNQTAKDVICLQEWNDFAASSASSWFHFIPVISHPGESELCPYPTGRISVQLFEDCLHKSLSKTTSFGVNKALVCGSHGFNAACKETLMKQTLLSIQNPFDIFIFAG